MKTHVLVGGKKRDVVLEARLRSIEQKSHDSLSGSGPVTGDHLAPYQLVEWAPEIHSGVNDYFKAKEIIRNSGYQRPPIPKELYSLLIAAEEGKLDPTYAPLVSKLEFSGVWLSCWLQVRGVALIVYEQPRRIILDPAGGNNHSINEYTWKSTFSIKGFPLGEPVYIKNHVTSDIIRDLWSRPFHELPEKVQEQATLRLPNQGETLPAYRPWPPEGFGIRAHPTGSAHTLGVRARQVSTTEVKTP